jgi:ABC-type Fe3+ transport system permease subunit
VTVDVSALGPALGFALGGAAIAATAGGALGALAGTLEGPGRRAAVGLSVTLIAAPPAFWWIGLTRLPVAIGRLNGVVPATVIAGLALAPITLLLVLAAAREAPSNAYDAARLSLGPTRRFWWVLVPFVRPGLIAGFLLTAILLLGESEIPFLLGFRTSMTDVVTTFSQTFTAGRTWPTILPLVAVVLMMALATVRPLLRLLLPGSTGGRGIVRKPGSGLVTIGRFALPLVLVLSIGGYARAAFSDVAEAWHRAWIGTSSVAISIAEPVLAAFTAVLVALLVAYPLRRSVISRVVAVSGLLLFCVPTAVVAIAWIAIGRTFGGISLGTSVAHLSRMVGLAVLGFLTAYTRLPRSQEDAARLVPVTPVRRAWTLVLPALRPSLAATAALIAALIFSDRDVASLLMAPGDSRLMLNLYLLSANAPSAAVGGTAIVVLVAGAIAVVAAAAGPAVLWWPRRE